jgi:hypothetical protein
MNNNEYYEASPLALFFGAFLAFAGFFGLLFFACLVE